MTSASLPPFPSDTPTADISTVDFDTLQAGDKYQAKAIHDAATGYGFFYLKNHGITPSTMFNLANNVFDLPLDEKMRYDMGTTGNYFGYKRSGSMFVDREGTPDHSQFYNISKNDMLGVGQRTASAHPQVISDSQAIVQEFMKACHHVVEVVLNSLGAEIGLDRKLLPGIHRIDRPSACQARLTHAPPLASGVISLGEHTDFGSLTVLFNELGGLQVLSPGTNNWKYVKPEPGCAIINIGDALVKLAGGRLYSGLHRVVGPPGEQAKCPRLSVVYFCRPNSDVMLRSLFSQDEGMENDQEVMNIDQWVAQRAKSLATANYKGPQSYKFNRGTAHNVKTAESLVVAGN